MNASPDQIQIVKIVINGFLPMVENLACAEKVLGIVQKYVEGKANQATTRCEVRDALIGIDQQVEDKKLNLCINTAHSLFWGYFHWMQGQEDADILDIYPALQLRQDYQRAEAINWIQRWQEFGGQIFPRNEMIALKNDLIWTRISFFHLPFPPFDLDSGMDVNVVSRNEAEKLGLIFPNKQVKPSVADLNFGTALRRRLEEYFSPESQQQKIEIAMQHADAGILLHLAQERLDSVEEITAEVASEITMILERALERGFGEDVQQEAIACGLLVDIFDSIEEFEKANVYREKQLESLKSWIIKGIPIDWNQLSKAYGLVATVYEKLNQLEQATVYRQLQMENRDGFTMLRDALDGLKACGGQIKKEVGAEILDELTKAAERIPQKYLERHAEIFRATGEILEALGDTAQAIEYYEFAMQKNPKVGVKRRLEVLRKASSLA